MALDMFCAMLGTIAGNLALTFGAGGGVYIAGGIARRYPEVLASSSFRAGFERKGRHSRMLERVPTSLITHEQPGLLGASYCALQLPSGTLA